jgi:hypothetical protein
MKDQSGCGSGGSCAAGQEMENEKDKANNEQDVNESRTDVEGEKPKQPENDQD